MAVGCRAVQAAEEKAFSDIIAKVTWKQDSDSIHHFRYFLTLEGAHVKYIALLASSNSSLDAAPEEHICCSLGKLVTHEAASSPSAAALSSTWAVHSPAPWQRCTHTFSRQKANKQHEPELR